MVFPLNKIARKTVAGFMAIWLSGFVFLFCCVAMYGGLHRANGEAFILPHPASGVSF